MQTIIQISKKALQLYGWETVKVNHYPARFGSHKHYGVGVLKEFVSLTLVATEIGKKEAISVIIAAVAKGKQYFIKNTNLLHSYYH